MSSPADARTKGIPTAGGAGCGRVSPSPIPVSRRARAVVLVLGAVALGLLFWQAPAVPLIAVGGILLALVLSFPVQLLSRLLPRRLAIAAAFAMLFGLLAVTVSSLTPVLAGQLGAFLAAAPRLFGDAERILGELLSPLAERGLLPGTPEEFLGGLASDLAGRIRGSAEGLFGSLLTLARSTVELTVGVLAAAVVAAYMLADGRKMKAACLRAAPAGYRRDVRDLWEAFAFTFSRYLSGLGFVMFVQGALSALVLWLLGVPYAAILGIWVALTAIVSLAGAWIGAVPGVLVALSVSPSTAAAAALLFLGSSSSKETCSPPA